jgi:MYXO-CTERM domain-containing protein
VKVGSSATQPVEYSWWIDDGTHSPWTRGNEVLVDHDTMLLQGRRVLHVTSRVVGDAATEDTAPVSLPFVIDTLAPTVRVEKRGARVRVEAWDFVSDDAALVARTRLAGGAWTGWHPLADARDIDTDGAATIDVEVKDEEGNVGRVSQALVRGKSDGSLSAGGGCDCSASARTAPHGARLALFGVLALAWRRVRRRGRSVR